MGTNYRLLPLRDLPYAIMQSPCHTCVDAMRRK